MSAPNLLRAALAACCAALLAACTDPKQPVAAPPAHAAAEDDDDPPPLPDPTQPTVRVTAEQAQRLGVTTEEVTATEDAVTRVFGGEVVVPPGRSVTLATPFDAIVEAAGDGASLPKPGTAVANGEALLVLRPLLSPERAVLTLPQKVDLEQRKTAARGEAAVTEARARYTRIAFERAELMLADDTGSARDRDAARGELELAEALHAAAAEQVRALEALELDADPGSRATQPVAAPFAGVVARVHVAARQLVPAGAPLVELVDPGSLWVRVPVYSGELATLDARAPARIAKLRDAREAVAAEPVPGPFSADAATASVDRFFALADPARFSPGERVAVTLTLASRGPVLTAPAGAVVLDARGGAWVYAQREPLVFERLRVDVLRIERDRAVLARGPAAGTAVVATGAMELYGTEFGFGK